jgi:hypothetical protein
MNMRRRIIDAIRLEISLFEVNQKSPGLFHTHEEMLELAIDNLKWRRPNLNDVLHPINKVWEELAYSGYRENAPPTKWETIMRLHDLKVYITKHWKFIEEIPE